MEALGVHIQIKKIAINIFEILPWRKYSIMTYTYMYSILTKVNTFLWVNKFSKSN